jgi:hypothetical protein
MAKSKKKPVKPGDDKPPIAAHAAVDTDYPEIDDEPDTDVVLAKEEGDVPGLGPDTNLSGGV